jgi:hypothetical protein
MSSMSVSRYDLRLYNYLKLRVVKELSQALSKIYISFDGWATKDGNRGFLGILEQYVDSYGKLQDLPIALPQLASAHSGKRMAEVILETLDLFSIDAPTVGYFVLDDASKNVLANLTIARKMGFAASAAALTHSTSLARGSFKARTPMPITTTQAGLLTSLNICVSGGAMDH